MSGTAKIRRDLLEETGSTVVLVFGESSAHGPRAVENLKNAMLAAQATKVFPSNFPPSHLQVPSL